MSTSVSDSSNPRARVKPQVTVEIDSSPPQVTLETEEAKMSTGVSDSSNPRVGAKSPITGNLLTTGQENVAQRKLTPTRLSISPVMSMKRRQTSAITSADKLSSLSALIMWKRKISNRKNSRRQDELPVQTEPSYHLEPKEKERFRAKKVSDIVNACHNFFLSDQNYNPATAANNCKMVCDDIRRQLNAPIDCPRYKVVVYTLITPVKGTSDLQLSSRSLLNSDTDSYVSIEYQNGSLRANTLVFWVYKD